MNKSARIQPRTLRGFRDYLPEAMIPRERLIDIARRVYRSYGFGPIDTPALEYLEILEGTFMIRLLRPWFTNTKKRLVKNPKLYLKDSGLFHTLSSIENHKQLLTHPKLGSSWEGFAMEQIIQSLSKPEGEFYYYRVHTGAELDLFFRHGGKNYGMEFKWADAQKIHKSCL